MSVAVGEVPICWSVESNLETILAAINDEDEGMFLVLLEAAPSGYDDELSGLDALDPDDLRRGCDVIAGAVRERGSHVLCGSLVFDRERWRNAVMYFSPEGRTWA